MEKNTSIQSAAELVRWLFMAAFILLFWIPSVYKEQEQSRLVVEMPEISQNETELSLSKKPEVSQDKTPLPLPEERPVVKVKAKASTIRGPKKEILFRSVIHEASDRHQVDPALIKAIIMAESGYNPKAVSKKGAMGLMQLMPNTAEALGVKDSFNPEHNIDAGVEYFKQLMNQFDGNVKLALAAYNAGSRRVRQYQGIPPFKATQYYVKKVLKYYNYYKEQMKGEIDRT